MALWEVRKNYVNFLFYGSTLNMAVFYLVSYGILCHRGNFPNVASYE